MKDWDPPLLNQRQTSKLLSVDLFQAEAKRMLQNHADIQARMRVAELRKSCGVEPQLSTISIRRPPRFESLRNSEWLAR